MSIFDIFKRESVTISAKSTLILPGSDQNRKVVCYKCEQEIDERHEVEGCRKSGTSRRVFFGRMAAIAAGTAVVARVTPELITAPAKPSLDDAILKVLREQQILLDFFRKQQAEVIALTPKAPFIGPVEIAADIPSGLRSGTFYAEIHGFKIKYEALRNMSLDRVAIEAPLPHVPPTIKEGNRFSGEQVFPTRRNWNNRRFEGSLHETITTINRELPHIALDLRQAIMSCNPEWRWRQAHGGGDMPTLEHEQSLGPLPRKILNPERIQA